MYVRIKKLKNQIMPIFTSGLASCNSRKVSFWNGLLAISIRVPYLFEKDSQLLWLSTKSAVVFIIFDPKQNGANYNMADATIYILYKQFWGIRIRILITFIPAPFLTFSLIWVPVQPYFSSDRTLSFNCFTHSWRQGNSTVFVRSETPRWIFLATSYSFAQVENDKVRRWRRPRYVLMIFFIPQGQK